MPGDATLQHQGMHQGTQLHGVGDVASVLRIVCMGGLCFLHRLSRRGKQGAGCWGCLWQLRHVQCAQVLYASPGVPQVTCARAQAFCCS